MKKVVPIFLLLVAFSWCGTYAQQSIAVPQVFNAINHDVSPPLRDMQEAPQFPTPWRNGIIPLNKVENPYEDHYQSDPTLQSVMGATGTSDLIQSWDGVSAQGYAPPDCSGDVSPNYYMEMVNVRFQIWDKTGVSLMGPLNLGTIWANFPGPWSGSLNDGDPVVLYDEVAGRWVATEFSLPNYPSGTPNYILVAVSQTEDPTGSWYRYGFTFPYMPDYPKYGVWPDGYYVSANKFAPSYSGTENAVFQRDSMLVGAPAQMVMFEISNATSFSLMPADWDGTNTPPAGAPNYFGQLHDNSRYGGTDGFDIFEFHVDWETPANSSFTGPTFIPTTSYTQVNNIPQMGTSTTLDDLSDRVMNRLNYRSFGSYQSMVTDHTVDAGAGRAGVRWYEFRNTGSGWTLFQEGTYAPADGAYRWMGSIAINANGAIGLGYSVSSGSMYPEIRYTGRLDGDPPGEMTIPEETIYASAGAQTGGLSRWGDYTQMTVDPNGEDFWYINQYQPSSGSFNWHTRIASFSFGPPCPIDLPTNPTPADEATDIPLTGNSISWTNGAGANTIEVWFGEAGNLSMIYDGSPIDNISLDPYEPFGYSTTYQWKVVGKNDTCDVSGPLWSFTTIPDPNLVTVFQEPFDNLNCWTAIGPVGLTNWSISNSNNALGSPSSELHLNWTPSFNGVSQLLSCDINSSTQYMNSVSLKHFCDFYANPAPFLGVAVTYDGGTTSTTLWEFQAVDGNVGPEDVSFDFQPEADTYQLIVYANGNSFNIDHWYVDDIMITYVVPVELTSFTAVANSGKVQLNWATATETNNRGFEVERKTSNSQYQKVGFVAGSGTTTEPKNYTYTDEGLSQGTYTYRLKQVDFNGSFEYTNEIEVDIDAPAVFALEQNFPNPFNPTTSIKYSIPADQRVKLNVYNLLGENVMTLVNGTQKAGQHEVRFDASNLASGIYFYKLEAGSHSSIKKMMLMK